MNMKSQGESLDFGTWGTFFFSPIQRLEIFSCNVGGLSVQESHQRLVTFDELWIGAI